MPLQAILLAAEEGSGTPNPLLPAIYDITWSLVVAVVIGLAFYRYVMPRFTQVLDERTARIEGGLSKAEQAEAEAAAVLAEYRQQLADARTDAARIREEARAEGERI
ncbi:MAG TPA: F0F1 ATP synthase subunit B, partial [Actinotalea sp.]|nr:F0F1 ATP synthase subunit B [Actinotalea sp.]